MIGVIVVFNNCSDKNANVSDDISEKTEPKSIIKNSTVLPNNALSVSQNQVLNIENEVQYLKVKNNADKKIELKSGSMLSFPKNCFVDKNGKPIKGEVDIAFEEFLTPGSIIASQIDMTYNQDGEKINFESAGMFRILAFKDNNPVFIAPEKTIKIGLPTNDESSGFNTYYSPSNGGDWNYLEDSKCEKKPNDISNNTSISLDNNSSKHVEPIAPSAYKNNGKYFDLQLYTNDKLLGVVWEYAGDKKEEDPAINPEWQSEEWTSASIKPLEGATNGVYEISLIGKTKSISTIARPVYKGKVLDAANQEFNEDLKVFNQMIEQQKNFEKQQKAENAMMRFVEVNRLGLYNYDRQLKYPNMVELYADFNFGTDTLKNYPISVYLITGNDLAVVKYVPETYSLFRYSTEDVNKLIAILPNQEVLTFSQKSFKNEVPKNSNNKPKDYLFNLKKTGVFAKDASDLDKLIKSL